MIIIVDTIIFALSFIGAKTVNLEQILFSNFASIITIIAQYVIPLIMLAGYLVTKKNQNKNFKAVKNEKIENHI